MEKWNKRFIELAQHVAGWGKDPSTKVGAVITDDLNRVVGMGFNGFPRGVEDDEERLLNREIKLEMVVHAEVNAILNAVKEVRGCWLYSTFFPCPRCAAVIIQAGIEKVLFIKNPSDERYQKERAIAEEMFNEGGVYYEQIG